MEEKSVHSDGGLLVFWHSEITRNLKLGVKNPSSEDTTFGQLRMFRKGRGVRFCNIVPGDDFRDETLSCIG